VAFVSGPFSDEPMMRTLEAADLQHWLMDRGYIVFCPHTAYFWTDQIRNRPYEDWMRQCLAFVAKSDIVVRMPGVSPGSDRECAAAESMGIPVLCGREDVIAWEAMDG
jgi:hypothetical protein